jgi:tetraacyldisaccharide 4'-kinase
MPRCWLKKPGWLWLLWPFMVLYLLILPIRRLFLQWRARGVKLSVPVVVVGNLTVGGAGKTPLVIYLVEALTQRGYRPGVISRGYGGKAKRYPLWVEDSTLASESGDEPMLIQHRTGCPVVVDPNRVAAARYLLSRASCDVIISDDGLQHYGLPRQIEIVVVEGHTRFGNGYCLPMGPLREPVSRLKSVPLVVCKGGNPHSGEWGAKVAYAEDVVELATGNSVVLSHFKKVHAVAGIASPEVFFRALEAMGVEVVRHPFPDHHVYYASDLPWTDAPIIMTEKDAVKCKLFGLKQAYAWPIRLSLNPEFVDILIRALTQAN